MADIQTTMEKGFARDRAEFEYRLRNAVKAAKAGQLTDENKALLKRVINAWGTEKARNPSAQPNTTACYTPTGAASCDAVLSVVEGSYTSTDTWYNRNVRGNGVKIVTGAAVVGGLWWWFKGRK
jgi:hypothetical protein